MKETLRLAGIYLLLLFVFAFLITLTQGLTELTGHATVQTFFQEETKPQQQKYVYYTDIVVDGVNIGVITTTPERVDDYLEYSWQVLDEYNFIPKEASSDQIKEAIKAPEGTLIIQVDDESYVSNPEASEALKKGIEFTKGLYSYEKQKEQSLGDLRTKIFSDKEISSIEQEAINKVTERLSGFEGDVDFYVKTSRALERIGEVESARKEIESSERQELEREVREIRGETEGKGRKAEGEGSAESDEGKPRPSRGGGDSGGSGGGGDSGPGQSGGAGNSENSQGGEAGQSGNAPGQGGESPGNSGNAPGHNK